VDILIAIADQTNAYEIAEEMTQYVKDVDEDLARAAIRAVGQIALKVSCSHILQCRLGVQPRGVCLSMHQLASTAPLTADAHTYLHYPTFYALCRCRT
jgi:hypothetical protein